ncbi:MAG: hypothetical protein AB1430_02805 [Pseudomonadota bacterium]
MKKIQLSAALLSLMFAAGAAVAQSTGPDSSGSTDTDTGSSAGPQPASSDAGSATSTSGTSSDATGSDEATGSSGTSSAMGGAGARHWNASSPLIRGNAAGGLPAGELSTPWQDTGGEAGSVMQ